MKTISKKEWEMIRLQKTVSRIKEIAPTKNTFSDITPFVLTMKRYERSLQKLAEHSCNGYPMSKFEYRDGKQFVFDVEDVAWRARCEKRESNIEKSIQKYAAEFNLVPEFQGDPRGVMFALKDAQGNTYEVA